MTTNPDPIAAAKAAYRIGLIDAMLHPDNIQQLPGIFRESLKGERAHRLKELQEATQTDNALEGWLLKP